MGSHKEELVWVYFGRSAWPFKVSAKQIINAGTTSYTTAKDRDLILMDAFHNIFDMQTCKKPKHISSCFIYFMPLVSFYNPWKHQKACSFLIYRLFANIRLSTVGYLRDLCLRLLVKRRSTSRPRILATKKIYFANECKYFYPLCCKRRSQRWH